MNKPVFALDAIVTVDEKGQIVLPKSLREKAGFEPKGKIDLLSLEKGGMLCCLLMIKADKLNEAVKITLGSTGFG